MNNCGMKSQTGSISLNGEKYMIAAMFESPITRTLKATLVHCVTGEKIELVHDVFENEVWKK